MFKNETRQIKKCAGRDGKSGYCVDVDRDCRWFGDVQNNVWLWKMMIAVVHGDGRPQTIVWRQCDTLNKGEDECSSSPGPDSRVPTHGQTCKCQQDFCNWRLVDVGNYTLGVAPAPAPASDITTPEPGTGNTNSAVAKNLPLHHLAATTCMLTGWTAHRIKSLHN